MQVLRLKGIDLLNIFHGVILFYMIILISVDFKRRKTLRRAPLGCPLLEKRQVQIHKNKKNTQGQPKIMCIHFVSIIDQSLQEIFRQTTITF